MVCITLLNKECFLGASGVDSINVIRDSSSEVTVPVKLIVSTICKESEESSVSVFLQSLILILHIGQNQNQGYVSLDNYHYQSLK